MLSISSAKSFLAQIDWSESSLLVAIIVLKIAAIVLTALAFIRLGRMISQYAIEKISPLAEKSALRGKQRVQTLAHTIRYTVNLVIIVVAFIALLQVVGIDPKAVIAAVGLAGIAIGFGAQSLVKDIIGGFFILSEDQFGVGDVVSINGEGGLVEKMTLRITQLRNTEGMLITIPNGSIQTVKNLTSEWSRVDYRIAINFKQDVERAISVIADEVKKLMRDMPEFVIEEPEMLGLDEIKDSSLVIRTWIKTAPLKQWDVKRELNKRIIKRFEIEKIEIPYPQQTVFVKNS